MNKKTGYAVRMAVLSAVSLTAAVFACVFFSMSLVMGYTGGMSAPFIALAISFALVMIGCFVAASVFMFISLYAIYREYAPSNAVLFLVLSVLIIVTMPFLLFSIRNKKSGYQLWCEQRAAAQAWLPHSKIPVLTVHLPYLQIRIHMKIKVKIHKISSNSGIPFGMLFF